MRLSARPVSLVVGLGADYVNRVSAELGAERLHVLQWQGDPARYVGEALGLGDLPPIELSPSTRLANVVGHAKISMAIDKWPATQPEAHELRRNGVGSRCARSANLRLNSKTHIGSHAR